MITFRTGDPRDLDLTAAVFRELLDMDEFAHTTAGITLPADLPDSAGVLASLTEWATARRHRGGAPVRVRLVAGARGASGLADALVHDRPLATYATRQATDTALLRLLDAALTPEHTDAVRVTLAGHDLFAIAAARVLADRRGVGDALEVEVLLGTAGTALDAVRADLGTVIVSTPVVQPDEFDAAIPYLARRLREGATSTAFSIGTDDAVAARERERFTTAVAALDDPAPTTLRMQDRRAPLGPPPDHRRAPTRSGHRPHRRREPGVGGRPAPSGAPVAARHRDDPRCPGHRPSATRTDHRPDSPGGRELGGGRIPRTVPSCSTSSPTSSRSVAQPWSRSWSPRPR
ncbi:proline dehydrogenase family protein [Curtobacterium sp. MCJR17_043]|uniref:proline dehydrogenase family protein n=1 Tax=Curtobacterium sp. MCJR17_043 TaxID=2175660 RepID=UPI0024DF8D5F|nr:proline dehydrogenase family protein [Curtobacterium sp. MCJR17_043]WIB36155.1 proline dehydrogenase family protein [Curtobacterium sp. MCJR17_043]